MVVTVIELVPRTRVHRRQRRFVAEGISALDELASRLPEYRHQLELARRLVHGLHRSVCDGRLVWK